MRRLIQMILRTPMPVVALLLVSQSAWSAGFALLEQSSSRLGTAFSGTAAAADDASTIYFNPAGMLNLERNEALLSFSDIKIKSEFADSASQAAFAQTLGNEGGDAGGWNFVPSAYWSSKIGDRLALGLGVNAPFGLKLEYDPNWIGRFQARRSEIKTLNINPAIALRINDYFSVGVGVDYQRIQAELSSAVNYSAAIAQGLQQLVLGGTLTPMQAAALTAANAGLQGHTVVDGDDWAWGFNVGLLFDVSANTRIGIHYRSPIDYTLTGDVNFSAPAIAEPTGASIIATASAAGGPLSSGAVSAKIKMPGSATVSLWQRVAPRVELLADAAWTDWSSIDELRVIRTSGATLSVTPEDWRNTWRVAFGGAFELNPTWKLRAGVAYDQSPVPDATRTPRVPDGDRNWVALGARWSPTQSIGVDFGYTHIFVKDAPLSQNAGNASAYGYIVGEQNSQIDIVSAQVSYKF